MVEIPKVIVKIENKEQLDKAYDILVKNNIKKAHDRKTITNYLSYFSPIGLRINSLRFMVYMSYHYYKEEEDDYKNDGYTFLIAEEFINKYGNKEDVW